MADLGRYFLSGSRQPLILPELGMGDAPIVASLWLVDVGTKVSKGDRLLEVLAGVATVDLPSPISGVLVETLVAEDDPLAVGQILGVIAAEE